MIRRSFLTLLGASAAAWPLAARAQQAAAVPVMGYLSVVSPEADRGIVIELRRGLADAGYVDGKDIAIEFRWGNNRPLALAALAAELVELRPAVIIASGAVASVRAAKAATSTIPIVMEGGPDPVKYRLVESLNRPGGNITGVTATHNELAGKRLSLLLDMVPQAMRFGFLTSDPRGNEVEEG